MDAPFLLAIDQGTTSSRTILFDSEGRPLSTHGIEISQHYPANGWVEHDPEEIWQSVLSCLRVVMRGVAPEDVAGIGIANQRETILLWDRSTGVPLYRAVVWQDRRTAERCHSLREAGFEAEITARTGLLLDPYFSATKLEWLLNHIPRARERAACGELACGTIDSWLIWKLTGGRIHATDPTNASRTMLFNLKTLDWDPAMLRLFNIPRTILPQIRDSAGAFGETEPSLFGHPLRLCGVAGDQQAASIGQACFAPGQVKSTYGTGCFALIQTGETPPASSHRLLATCACRIAGKASYAIEGSIFTAGAVVQWLRDHLGIIADSASVELLARQAKDIDGLYFIPAFTGLGAPYWDPDVRGAIFGLTADTGAGEIAKAALDAVCYQTRDLLEAIAKDLASTCLGLPKSLKVDGGMVRNDWFCQRLADLTGLPVERPQVTETTALGAAYLAGLAAGLFQDISDIESRWHLDRRFVPLLASDVRDGLYAGWTRAVARARNV